MSFFDGGPVLVEIRCCVCDVLFGATETLIRARKADKAQFWCPNGHSQSFTQSTAQRLEQELARTQAQLTAAREARDRALEAELRAQRKAKRLERAARRTA